MTQEKFESLVRRLEDYSRQRPRAYRFRVALLAALGYGVVFLALVVLLALLGALVVSAARGAPGVFVVPAGVCLVVLIAVVVRSMWVPMPEPVGVGLDRAKYPAMFETVDQLAARLGCPPVHRILVDDEFNAAMAQVPRWGPFGPHRNYLRVGLPLMHALTPEQFGAVVAHEMGHLSGRHGRFNAWVYRVQETWLRLLGATLAARRYATAVTLARFLRWYSPYFAAYTFVLRRANEYEADRCAAEIAGVKVAAEALLNVRIASRFLDDQVWPEVYKKAETAPEPPPGVLGAITRVLPRAAAAADARKWARQAMMEDPEFDDTHPQLAERLAAIGYLAAAESELAAAWHSAPPPPVSRTAAQHFLGPALAPLTDVLERGWRVKIGTAWQRQYRSRREALRTLRGLDKQAEYSRISDDSAWRRCLLTLECRGERAAIPLLRQMRGIHVELPQVNFLLGKALLKENDPAGIAHLERAMADELACVFEACELIYDYLTRLGRNAEAETYLRRAEVHRHSLKHGARERMAVKGRDEFRHHGLTGDYLYYLCERLAEVTAIAEAWLVEKVVRNFADHKLYVLGVVPHGRASRRAGRRILEDLLPKIKGFELPLHVVVLNDREKELSRAVRAVEGARIYPPSRPPGRRAPSSAQELGY